MNDADRGFRRAKPVWRALRLLLTGGAVGLGQVPFGLVWLAVPALAVAILFGTAARNPRHAGWRGFLIGSGFGLITTFWVAEPFLVNIGRDGWLAPFALFFMSAGFGLFWALGYWTARRVAGRSMPALFLALPVYLTLAEILRSYALSGFPWGLTAYIWIDTPVYQFAAFVGPHGLTLATMLFSSSLAVGWVKRRYLVFPGLFVLIGAAFLLGKYLENRPVADPRDKAPIVRLVQPNAPQKQKWDPEFMPVFFERQLKLTAERSTPAPDLVIWPEVAVPFLLNDPTSPFDKISRAAGSAPVIIGALRIERSKGATRAFNSMALIGEGGAVNAVYDKYHLVPFGEYIPGRGLFDKIGIDALAAIYGSGYTAGPGPEVMDLGPLGKALPLICYEAIFPHEIRRVKERPDFLLMLTNDAWFGEISGPYQHFAQARARSIEFGLPMLRAANTGISAVVTARGEVVKALPLGVSGRIDAPLPPPAAATLYWKTGDIPMVMLLIVLAMLAMRLKRRNPIDPDSTGM